MNQRYWIVYWCKNWDVILVRMHLGHYLWKPFSVASAWYFSVTFYHTWFQVLVKSEDHTLMTHAFIISAIMFIYKHHNCVWKNPHISYETRIDCTVLCTKFKFCPLNIINMIHQTEFLKTNYFTAFVPGVGGYPNSLINIKYLPCGGKIYLPWTYYSEKKNLIKNSVQLFSSIVTP